MCISSPKVVDLIQSDEEGLGGVLQEVAMNWFERYGIVGSYFIILLLVIFKFNSHGTINFPEGSGPVIAAIFVAASLTVGYILSVLSQAIYYEGHNGLQIHKEVIGRCEGNQGLKEKLQRLEIYSVLSEADIETRLTSFYRLMGNDTKKLRYLGVFATKRWDVIAIDSAMIWGTWMAYFLWILFKIVKLCWFRESIESLWSWWDASVIFITLLILLFLYSSRRSTENQIVNINVDVLKYTFFNP